MDRLWTPWRFDYIRGIDQKECGCVFCRIPAENDDAGNLLLHRGRHSFVLMNLFPYTSGHLLIVANRHIAFLEEAEADELAEIITMARVCEKALKAEYKPEGLNLGFNLGRAAGAGVAGHLHMHVLPRWSGDSNFVSVLAETRILPETLPCTYKRLLPHFADLSS